MPVHAGTLFQKGQELVLRYTYEIIPEQCGKIQADIPYYLEVSPHLVLPDLPEGSELTVEKEDGSKEQFGTIYADEEEGKAWVKFLPDGDPQFKTVLEKYGSLEGAYFYLNCRRADEVPPTEAPIAGENNLYAMKFEDNSQLNFGYEEKEPVWAKAAITKDGSAEIDGACGVTGHTSGLELENGVNDIKVLVNGSPPLIPIW